MIETLAPPRDKRGGVVVCDTCDAHLKYAADDVTLAYRNNQQAAQLGMTIPRSFVITCPHCKHAVEVRKP